MKIRIYIKDPDVLQESIDEAVDAVEMPGLSQEEADAAREVRKEQYRDIADKWFEYGEYVELEMDTDAKTMVVVPRS